MRSVQTVAAAVNGACIDCGGEIALCLARLGSLRCHDCREDANARLTFAPSTRSSRLRALLGGLGPRRSRATG